MVNSSIFTGVKKMKDKLPYPDENVSCTHNKISKANALFAKHLHRGQMHRGESQLPSLQHKPRWGLGTGWLKHTRNARYDWDRQ
jgi:hypothetical protein